MPNLGILAGFMAFFCKNWIFGLEQNNNWPKEAAFGQWNVGLEMWIGLNYSKNVELFWKNGLK